mgnify:CR=1 FL=1
MTQDAAVDAPASEAKSTADQRAGRAGREGMAISLCTPRELPRAAVIEERLGAPLLWDRNVPSAPKANTAPPATMTTLRIDAGKTDKLRPGDVLYVPRGWLHSATALGGGGGGKDDLAQGGGQDNARAADALAAIRAAVANA